MEKKNPLTGGKRKKFQGQQLMKDASLMLRESQGVAIATKDYCRIHMDMFQASSRSPISQIQVPANQHTTSQPSLNLSWFLL